MPSPVRMPIRTAEPRLPPRLVSPVLGVALLGAVFLTPLRGQDVAITEIHYFPTTSQGDAEFVEVHNPHPLTADISGFFFAEGISFIFPEGAKLEPRGCLVVARDPDRLRALTGLGAAEVVGPFGGRLANEGEAVALANPAGRTIARVRYNERERWPVEAAGGGHTLELRDPFLDSGRVESWRASRRVLGTPGRVGDSSLPDGDGGAPQAEAYELFVDGACFGPGISAAESWLAVRSEGSSPVPLEGIRLSPDPDGPDAFTFPAGESLDPGARRILRGDQLPFPHDAPRLKLFLIDRDGSRALHAVDLDAPSGRRGHLALFPGEGLREGEREWLLVEGLEPQAERRRPVPPSIAIDEIHYHALDPLADPDEEYLEVHNHGGSTVDLSGFRFVEGVSFAFPPGTTLAAGGYLVVARNPEAVALRHGIDGVLGPWEGALSNSGELLELADADGNPVDAVRYHDGGAWPRDADGWGSSLELLDPRQPNDAAAAWAASIEGDRSEWTRFEYTGRHSSGEPELHLLLLQSGSCLIDDVSVEADGVEHIPNGGFEDGLDPWIADGTHIHSHVTDDDAVSGKRSLRIRAVGRGDTGANHIEIETIPPLLPGKMYTVSFWARWERGTTRLMTRSYDQGMAKVHRLAVPEPRGTPGAANTVARNPGPAIDRLRQIPALARPGAPVLFRARIRDADGVASAALRYRRDGAASFETVPMLDDGASGDELAGDGTFAAEVPPLAAGTVVELFLEASDALGHSSRLPEDRSVDDPDRTAFVYQVDGSSLAGQIRSFRLVMTRAVRQELATRSQTSNLLLPITVVVDSGEVRHRAWLRQRGCLCSRGLIQPPIWRLKVGAEDPLGGREEINLDNQHADPTNQRDRVTYHLMRSVGSAPYPDSRYVRVYRNGVFDKVYEDVDKVDTDFVGQSFGSSAGPLFKVDGWFEFPDSGPRYVWKPGTMMHLGENQEEYRWRYDNRGELEELDDWGPLIDLLRFLDPNRTPNDVFGAEVNDRLPPDNWIRSVVVRVLVDAWDAVGVAGGKNAYLYQDPATSLWWMLPFDNDATFGPNRNTPLMTSSFPSLQRFFRHPAFVRRYYATFRDILAGPFRREALAPMLDETYALLLKEAPTTSPTDLKSFVTERAEYVEGQLPKVEGLRILTNGGNPVVTEKSRYVVLGEAALEAEVFLLDGSFAAPVFLTETRFQLGIHLSPGTREYVLEALGADLARVGTASIQITSTAVPEAPQFRRGDSNADGEVNISDGIHVLDFLFLGGKAPPCTEASDADDDGVLNISDGIFVLGFLFLGGPAPPAPGPTSCGPAPGEAGGPGDLGCAEYTTC